MLNNVYFSQFVSKILLFLILVACLFLFTCSPQKIKKHIFYLHSNIIELQGPNAYSEQFGAYEFEEIIAAFSAPNHIIYADIRDSLVNFDHYCTKISNQIDSLIAADVDPKNICVIGASKGGVMAMQISDQNTNPIKYVWLGANTKNLEASYDWDYHGYILAFYDTSDKIANADYAYWINSSTKTKKFIQVGLDTGRGHGFLYTAMEEWVKPSLAWIYY